MNVAVGGPPGGTRPPIMVVVLGLAFVLLMAALIIGSLTTPEFPPYEVTATTPVEVGDSLVGPATYTVDASEPERWQRFDFSRNGVVDSGGWDIALRRSHVAAGPGVGLLDLGAVPFDSVVALPEVANWVTATATDTAHPAIGKWYDYSYLTHLLTSKRHVYVLRTAAGRYAKLEILNYYCAGVGAACITFRYAYQGDGSARFARRNP